MQNIDIFETLVRYSDCFETWCWFVYNIQEEDFCVASGTAESEAAARFVAKKTALMHKAEKTEAYRASLVGKLDDIESELLIDWPPPYSDTRWAEAVALHRDLDLVDMELAIDWQFDYEGYFDWLDEQGGEV